jgi:hypothetical protein
MPYYLVESPKENLTIGDVTLHGIPTTGHSRALWLYVVSTEDNPKNWPESPTGRGTGHRRAPDGELNWWVVAKPGAKARSSEGLRSTGNPLYTPPQGYPVFNWPNDVVPDETDAENAGLADDLERFLPEGRIGTTQSDAMVPPSSVGSQPSFALSDEVPVTSVSGAGFGDAADRLNRSAFDEGGVGVNEHWEQVWSELSDALSDQPRCPDHPQFPCIQTLGQGAVNDILRVDQDGVRVRSHRTGNEDMIPVSSFQAWWAHLQQHGTAALDPNDPNCPRSDRAVLVGAILARCLPNRVKQDGGQIRLLAGAAPRDEALPEEVPAGLALVEGTARTILVNAYERDPEVRRRCIAEHGTSCAVCGMNFAAEYGSVADGYIHVHHLRPLSEVRAIHEVDPVADLRPVCPNCHAVVHRRVPPHSVDEVRAFWLQMHAESANRAALPD